MNQATIYPMKAAVPGSHWWVRLIRAPVVLQAYIVFAVCAVSLSLVTAFVPPLARVAEPIFGGADINYGFTFYFAISAAIGAQRKLIYGVILLLGVFILFGCFQIFGHLMSPNPVRVSSGNPYLVYHDFRPAFSIVCPAFWIAALLSPSMRTWIQMPASRENSRPYQFSLAELLYFVLIACVALASALAFAAAMNRARESAVSAPATSAPTSGNPRFQPSIP